MNESAKIYIANHRGLVGAAVVRQLLKLGHRAELLITRSPELLNLQDQAAVMAFMAHEKPDQIYLPIPCLSAGDGSTTTSLLNLVNILSVIHAASLHQVGKLLLIGTPHVYPQNAMSPTAEEDLLTGPLDPATESLGLAQITALKLCGSLRRGSTHAPRQAPALDYRCLITAATYGPGEPSSETTGTSITGLIQRLHQAKLAAEPCVPLPFSGDVWNEYLHVDDAARAATYLMNVTPAAYTHEIQRGISHINAGEGKACSTRALVHSLAGIVGYTGDITFAPATPGTEPTLRRLDSHRIHQLGWYPALAMEDGLALTYFDYLARTQRTRNAAAV